MGKVQSGKEETEGWRMDRRGLQRSIAQGPIEIAVSLGEACRGLLEKQRISMEGRIPGPSGDEQHSGENGDEDDAGQQPPEPARSSPFWRISIRRVTRFTCAMGCEAHGLVTPFLTMPGPEKPCGQPQSPSSYESASSGPITRAKLDQEDSARAARVVALHDGGEEAAQMWVRPMEVDQPIMSHTRRRGHGW